MVRTRHPNNHDKEKFWSNFPAIKLYAHSFLRDNHTHTHNFDYNYNHNHDQLLNLIRASNGNMVHRGGGNWWDRLIDRLTPPTCPKISSWLINQVVPQFLDKSFIWTRDFIKFHSKSPDNTSTHHHVVPLIHETCGSLSHVRIRGVGTMWYFFSRLLLLLFEGGGGCETFKLWV